MGKTGSLCLVYQIFFTKVVTYRITISGIQDSTVNYTVRISYQETSYVCVCTRTKWQTIHAISVYFTRLRTFWRKVFARYLICVSRESIFHFDCSTITLARSHQRTMVLLSQLKLIAGCNSELSNRCIISKNLVNRCPKPRSVYIIH